MLDHNRATLGLVIPPGWTENIKADRLSPLQVLLDGSDPNYAGISRGYITIFMENYNQKLRADFFNRKGMEKIRPPAEGRIRVWFNEDLESRAFIIPGMIAIIIMIVGAMLTSLVIAREYENGTMEQLIVTPLKPAELILGKTIPFILIAQAQMVMVTIFAVFWFQIPLVGSIGLLFAATCLFLLSTLGIGLFISTISATQQQAMMTTFFFVLPFFMLSGFVFPIANMPLPVQWLTYLNPLRYFLIIIRGIFLKGTGFHVLWPQLVGLTILGGIVFIGAVSRFKKRLD